MESLYKKHITIMIILAVVLIASAIGLWQFGKRMKMREARVHEVKQQLATYNQNKRVFAEESASLRAIDARLSTLEAKRVTTATIPDTLSSLEDLAAQHNLTFSISSVQEPKEGEDEVLTIGISAKGSSSNIMQFLNDVLAQPYELRFARYSLFKEQLPQPAPGAPTPSESWELLAGIEILSFSK